MRPLPMDLLIRRVLVGFLIAFSLWAGAAGIEQWDFNGTLVSSAGGSNLVLGAAAPASSPDLTFTSVSIGGQPAQAAAFSRGTYFRLTHRLGANAGGAYLNAYTLIM